LKSQNAKEAEGKVAASQLVERALQGDKDAFCALVSKY